MTRNPLCKEMFAETFKYWTPAVTIHSQPKPVKWKTKEIVFYLKANQRFSGRYDLSGCLMSYFL